MQRILAIITSLLLIWTLIVPMNVNAQDDMMTIAVSMEKFTLGQGYIIEPILVTVPRNTQASVVITDLLKQRYPHEDTPFHMTGQITKDFYLAHVLDDGYQDTYNVPAYILNAVEEEGSEFSLENDEWLGEFDFFKHSGWMYAVNNAFPGVGAAGWTLKDSQVMRWQFTIFGLGADLNANNEIWGTSSVINTAQKDNLTWRVAEINSMSAADKAAFLTAGNNKAHYDKAYDVLTNMESTQAEVDAALEALGGTTRVAEEVEVTMPEVAQHVNDAIKALPSNIKLTDAALVAQIRASYEALDFTMQQWIWRDELSILTSAEHKIAQLQDGVAKVEAQIAALPSTETITVHDELTLKEAQNAYALLTKEQQQAVTNVQRLSELTTKIAELKKDTQAVASVIADITALPATITLADELTLQQVKAAFDQLTVAQQKDVTNAADLTKKLEALAILKQTEKNAITDVIAQIAALPTTMTLADEVKLQAAKSAYEALAVADQALVTNASILQALQLQLDALKKPMSDQAVKIVNTLIESLPTKLTLEHAALVQAIETAFNTLTTQQQLLVTNYMKLIKAVVTMEVLQEQPVDDAVANVQARIAALPAVASITYAHKAEVVAIRASYDALTTAQRAHVTNETKLAEIEAKMTSMDIDVRLLIDEIASLPEAPAAETITMLQQAYDSLTKEQQQAITNIDVLTKLQQGDNSAVDEPAEMDEAIAQSTNVTAITAQEETLIVTVQEEQAVLSSALLQQAKTSIIIEGMDVTLTLPAALLDDLQRHSALAIDTRVTDTDVHIQLFEVLENGIERDIVLQNDYVEATFKAQHTTQGVYVRDMDGQYVAVPHTIDGNDVTIYINDNAEYQYITPNRTFADIQGIGAQDDIEFLANRYVVNGTSETTYAPTTFITRAQFGAMMARALNLQAMGETVYDDVKGKWYETHIQALYEAGITNANRSFNPGAPLTREHAAAFMFRLLQYIDKDVDTTTMLSYTDNETIQPQFAEAVSTLHTLGIMEGKDGNKFDAKGHLTRAQMAKILRRTLAYVEMMS